MTTEVIPPALSSGTVCEAQLSHHAVYAGSGNGTATMDVVVPSGCAWTARMLYGNATIVHDRMVGDLKASGWSDRRANIPSMPGAYALTVYALFQNSMNRIQGEPSAFLICH